MRDAHIIVQDEIKDLGVRGHGQFYLLGDDVLVAFLQLVEVAVTEDVST